MSAIWHQSDVPSFLCPAPQFSFFDVAEIVQPAPESYAEARAHLQAWERRLGAGWYQRNALDAKTLWESKKPWWL